MILSNNVQSLINGDELFDFYSVSLDRRAVFPSFNIEESEFDKLVWESFEKILKILRQQTDNNEDDMDLKELCCCKAILELLNSSIITLNDGKFAKVDRLNAVEILNTLGSEDSINFVAENLMDVKWWDIAPERLEWVLQSKMLNVSKEGDILEVVLENIKRYGVIIERLLGYIRVEMLELEERKKYLCIVKKYLESKKNADSFIVYKSILNGLFRCVEDEFLFNELDRLQDMVFNKTIKLNDVFKGRIAVSSMTVLANDDNFKAENVLSSNDNEIYCSVCNQESRGQWIKFDFPEEVWITRVDIKPIGKKYNPKSLKIEAAAGNTFELIAEPKFPNEKCKMYFINTNKVLTKSIRILLDSETYSTDYHQYALWLYEVVFNGELT